MALMRKVISNKGLN